MRYFHLKKLKQQGNIVIPGVLTREGGHLPRLEPRLRSLPHRLLLLGHYISQHLLRTSSSARPAPCRPHDRCPSGWLLDQPHHGATYRQRPPARVRYHSNSEGESIPRLNQSTGGALAGLHDQLSWIGPHPGHPLLQLPQAHHLSAGGIHQRSGRNWGQKGR